MDRVRGRGKHGIDSRHVIDSLVRKPGAFAYYRFRQDLFPRLIFRIAYDWLCEHAGSSADKQYVRLLEMAAKQGEEIVAGVLQELIARGEGAGADRVLERVRERALEAAPEVPRIRVGA